MIADIIIFICLAYLLYKSYTFVHEIKPLQRELNDLKNINRSLWSLANGREADKGKTGRTKPRANKATPGIGKGVKKRK